MGADAYALLLLLVTLAVAFTGALVYVGGSTRRAELAARGGSAGEPGRGSLLAALDVRLRRTPTGRRLAQWVQSAGGRLRPIDVVVLAVGGGLVLTVLLSAVAGFPVTLVIGFAISIGGVRFYVERERARRRDEFVAQLPEIARQLSNGTSAGLSLAGAVEMSSHEIADPAGEELRYVVQEMRLGQPLDVALERLRDRLPSREVAVLMTTIIIQQRAGGDTVRALNELGGTLDARKDLLRELKTMLSGSVFTGYLVAGVGALAVLGLNLMSPGVLREMTTTGLGIMAIIVTVILWAIGFALIRQATRVDV